ncbi:STAS domain-containing protein [Desulfitobacterium sp. Sab5]|uniref:STAS domain-containing protein n=1 Tax=Desulfitobacterium TaxID=36853 RepID=UPI003CE88E9C
MAFDIRESDQEIYVDVGGTIFVEDAALLREKLHDLVDRGHNRFVINMQRATYIDSSGLGVLVALHKRALQQNGGVIIKGSQGVVKELFIMTRLNKVFEMQ